VTTQTPTEQTTGFDAGLAYEMHPQVALRPERFGALAYHYGNRRLTFLKAAALVDVVSSLADHASAHDAVVAAVGDGDDPSTRARRAAYEKALAGLQTSEVIRVR
jgi:putative mycofactocin binding protein MftB